MSKSNKNHIKMEVYTLLLIFITAALFIFGCLFAWANNYTSNMVRNELAAQKIYFPEKGSPALDPSKYPDLQQYAGQLVDSPEKAKAYANGYIGRHLHDVADGKVYAEVSAESKKDPANEELQKQKQTLFQGETLRGMLLTSGYGFGMVGKIAGFAAVATFVLCGISVLLAIVMRSRMY